MPPAHLRWRWLAACCCRGCFTFDGVRKPAAPGANASLLTISAGGELSNFVRQSATVNGFDSGLLLRPSNTAPVVADGNVVSCCCLLVLQHTNAHVVLTFETLPPF